MADQTTGAGRAGGPVTVEQVPPEATYPLRRRVLRPGRPLGAASLAVDGEPTTATFAARTTGGEVIGTAVTYPAACAWRPGAAAWRLRAMATAPEYRNAGIGARLLATVVAHVCARGGEVLWCNARTPARRFYERAGFVAHGDEWEEPGIGPHVAMWRRLC
jgi:GNAT superfamily N-acetyltransferase